VNICQKGEPGPPAKFHDERIVDALEFECHGSGCTEGMGAHPLEIVALGNKVRVSRGLVDKASDVGWLNMKAWLDKAQGGSGGASMGVDAVNTLSQGFDGAEPARACSVVNSRPTLPIFLVIHP
jgi:hypothetical protein